MAPAPEHSSRSSNPGPLLVALATYLSAALLLVVAEPALVYGAAHFLPQGRARGVAAAASEFARSVPGILCATLASSTVLGLTAWASARLQGGRVAVNLRIGPSRGSLAGIAATVVGTVGLGLASGSAADLLGVGRSGSMNTMATVLSHASGLQIVRRDGHDRDSPRRGRGIPVSRTASGPLGPTTWSLGGDCRSQRLVWAHPLRPRSRGTRRADWPISRLGRRAPRRDTSRHACSRRQ